MTQLVYQGHYYNVLGTSYDWGVRFEVNAHGDHKLAAPAVRFASGDCYIRGYREPRRFLWIRQRSIQEAAAIAVDRCRLADEQYAHSLKEQAESSAELKATAEVQKIVGEL